MIPYGEKKRGSSKVHPHNYGCDLCSEKNISKTSERMIFKNFATKLINSQKNIDPEIVDIVNDNFWELL